MKVVHFCQLAPNLSGMYESTKDQIKYERREGLESDLVDSMSHLNKGKEDGWLEAVSWEKAKDAEIWIIHSSIPPPLLEYIKDEKNRKKHIIISNCHGPVEHMLLQEYSGALLDQHQYKGFTENHINLIWNYDACVVINQHEYDVSILYDENDRLHYIPNSIDLERVDQKATPWPYMNHPAIVVADYPRFEKTPAHMIWAMPKIIEKIPSARLSVLGLPFENIEFWRNIFHRSKVQSLLRCIDNLHIKRGPVMPFFNGADIMFNANFSGICSRVHMEAMLLGVPVVSYNGDYTKYHAKIFNLDSIAEQIGKCWKDLNNPRKKLREKTIEYAHKHFDRGVHVKKYVQLYEKLKEGKNA
jgi:glycosyltransferase involved in cell wall biosynthesis